MRLISKITIVYVRPLKNLTPKIYGLIFSDLIVFFFNYVHRQTISVKPIRWCNGASHSHCSLQVTTEHKISAEIKGAAQQWEANVCCSATPLKETRLDRTWSFLLAVASTGPWSHGVPVITTALRHPCSFRCSQFSGPGGEFNEFKETKSIVKSSNDGYKRLLEETWHLIAEPWQQVTQTTGAEHPTDGIFMSRTD